jgi:hypothetical protein
MQELIKLWQSLLGAPPAEEQFTVWLAMHTHEVIRLAIARTAAKNLSVGKTMDSDYKIRFASKVMLTQTERNNEHAANREKLAREFDAKAGDEFHDFLLRHCHLTAAPIPVTGEDEDESLPDTPSEPEVEQDEQDEDEYAVYEEAED